VRRSLDESRVDPYLTANRLKLGERHPLARLARRELA
jgi:hypothetical protein